MKKSSAVPRRFTHGYAEVLLFPLVFLKPFRHARAPQKTDAKIAATVFVLCLPRFNVRFCEFCYPSPTVFTFTRCFTLLIHAQNM